MVVVHELCDPPIEHLLSLLPQALAVRLEGHGFVKCLGGGLETTRLSIGPRPG